MNNQGVKRTQRSITLPPHLWDLLTVTARTMGMSQSQVVEDAVRRVLLKEVGDDEGD